MTFRQPTFGAPGPVVQPPTYPLSARHQRRGVLAPVLGLVALGICGLLVVGFLLSDIGTGGVLVGTLGALLPVGPVVAAFLWMDRWEPEPPRMLLVAFLWGACFATLAALLINTSVELAVRPALGESSAILGAVVVAPFVEETMKGLFLLGLFWFRRREFDGVLDGIVYAGLVAAGFAFTENILYLGATFAEGAQTGQSGAVLVVLLLRGVFSPFAHPLFTAMIGIGLGLAANARGRAVRVAAPVGGYLLAVFLHALWNGSASLAGGQALVLVYLLVMVPIFGFVLLLVYYQRRREQRVIAAELPGFAHAGWIVPSEIGLLQSLAGRRGWHRAVRQRSGPAAAKAVGQYQAAVTELAFLRHKIARGSVGPYGRQWHDGLVREVVDARARAVGMPEALSAAWSPRTPPPGWAPPVPPPGPGGPEAGRGATPLPVPPPGPPPGPPVGPGAQPGRYPQPPGRGRAPTPWLPSQHPGPPPVPPPRQPPSQY
ncbi:MAG: PrsW family intramembrane metalloprotease [Pseudonocardia sp.]